MTARCLSRSVLLHQLTPLLLFHSALSIPAVPDRPLTATCERYSADVGGLERLGARVCATLLRGTLALALRSDTDAPFSWGCSGGLRDRKYMPTIMTVWFAITLITNLDSFSKILE
ncbi:MAG TPA: hypothetical protein VG759_17755 [Candidatus Angelobacter sp.]|jgi:hypothetical protein|nr:hypothetical protein [Candidatus Angelobacter sp.]